MSKSKIFFYSCLFFILGVGVGSYLPMPLWAAFGIFIAGCGFLFWGWPRKEFVLLGLAGIFLFLGILRYAASVPATGENQIQFYNGRAVTFVGVVERAPDIRAGHVKLTVNSSQLTVNSVKMRIGGNVLVNTKLYPEYRYGDKLEIICELRAPEPIEDFAYDKYLAKENIYSLCYWPEIKLLESGRGNKIMAIIFWVKGKLMDTVGKILPEPQAAFLGGLLYGARRGIPEDLMDKFNATGTTHIIAISGYNITILAAMLLKLTKGIGLARKKSFWLALLGISFFVILTGASASVVRAAIMGGLVLLAGQVGRASRITNALLAAAAIMLIFNPKVLAFDVGFQLSFAATVGLIFLAPIFEKYLAKWPSVFGVKESFTATMAAIILTLPLILYTFGRVSLVAPLANVLILFIIPLTMAAGFIAVAGGLIYAGLGQVLGWLAWLLLSYIITVVEHLSKIPWTSAQIGKIHWIFLVIFYLAIGFYLVKKYKLRELTRREIK
jgi:competence protein ComEC